MATKKLPCGRTKRPMDGTGARRGAKRSSSRSRGAGRGRGRR